jgi:hypothetical protein
MASTFRLLASDPYIGQLNSSNVNLGFFGPLEAGTLTITHPDPDKVQILSKKPGSYGQAVASYSKPKPSEIEISFNEMPPEVLSWAMLGTVASYSQASGTDAELTFTARHDKWVYVGKHHLSAFTIAGKSATTDFNVVLEAGLVKVLSTGTIVNEASVTATASYPAKTGDKISAGTASVFNVTLKAYVTNLFDNVKSYLEIPKMEITPSGGLNFAADEPIAGVFKGTIIKLTGQDLYSLTELD